MDDQRLGEEKGQVFIHPSPLPSAAENACVSLVDRAVPYPLL